MWIENQRVAMGRSCSTYPRIGAQKVHQLLLATVFVAPIASAGLLDLPP